MLHCSTLFQYATCEGTEAQGLIVINTNSQRHSNTHFFIEHACSIKCFRNPHDLRRENWRIAYTIVIAQAERESKRGTTELVVPRLLSLIHHRQTNHTCIEWDTPDMAPVMGHLHVVFHPGFISGFGDSDSVGPLTLPCPDEGPNVGRIAYRG